MRKNPLHDFEPIRKMGSTAVSIRVLTSNDVSLSWTSSLHSRGALLCSVMRLLSQDVSTGSALAL